MKSAFFNKRSFINKIIAGIMVVTMMITIVGCGSSASQNDRSGKDGSLKKVLNSGHLILGLDSGFPPMGFIDDNGEIVGFDIDAAREVCNRLGVKLITQPIDWDEKENDLNSGRIDCIWNGLSITPERAESMNLSEPYMRNELIVMVLRDSDAKGMRDLAGRKIGVQSGATAQDVLEASDIYSEVTVKKYDTVIDLLEKLDAREVDAALIDSVVAFYYILLNDSKYYLLPDSLGEEEYAIGFRKEDTELRNKIQAILATMKTDGTLGRISKKWFGSDITIVK